MLGSLSEEQIKEIKEKTIQDIKNEYFLVGINSIIGGAIAFLIAAGFVSWGGAETVLRGEAAQTARDRIEKLKVESETIYNEIKTFRDNTRRDFEPLVQIEPASIDGCQPGDCSRILHSQESNPAELTMKINADGYYLIYANYACRTLRGGDSPGRFPEETFFINDAQFSHRYGYQLCHYNGNSLNSTSTIGRISHPITAKLSTGDNLRFRAAGWGTNVNQYRVVELYAVRIFP